MDGAIFGFEYAEPLGKEDFDQILYHMQLSVGVINTYMRYIRSTLFKFLNKLFTRFI